MATKEILIYSSIHSYTAEYFINQLEAYKDDDVVLRINTPGGNPIAAFGMIAKIQEHAKSIKVKVDGAANSMGSFLLAYVKDVEALDVSTFLIHRAAYSTYYESEGMSEAERDELVKMNNNLRAALESKINVEKLQTLKNVSMDEIFSMEKRIDVVLTAQEALDIGLISSINKLTPKEIDALNTKYLEIAAHSQIKQPIQEPQNTQTIKNNKMNINELKANHPALYDEVFKAGSDAGVKAEKDRVGAYLAFIDVDTKSVAEAIKGTEPLSMTVMAELNRKAFAAQTLASTEDENAEEQNTSAANNNTEEPTAVDKFQAELDKLHKTN